MKSNTIIRNSNAELLRLVCMLMIVVNHFIVCCLNRKAFSLGYDSVPHGIMLFMDGFFLVCVNCFILISGYYGIRPKLRSFIGLYFICSFYALLLAVKTYVFDAPDTPLGEQIWQMAVYALLPFSHLDSWFVSCYVALFLLSPVLNLTGEHMTRKQYLWLLVVLTFYNVYMGYIQGDMHFNHDGYTVAQFVYLYLIAGYLRRYLSETTIRERRWKSFGWYMASVGIWMGITFYCGLGDIINIYPLRNYWHAFFYNNPPTLLASVFFFLFMMSFSFKSRAVNRLATSCLSVYLLQHHIIGYTWLAEWGATHSPWEQLAVLFPVSIVFMLLCLLFDKVRILLQKPLWMLYERCCKPITAWWERWMERN